MLTPDQQAFLDKIKNDDDNTQDGTKRALIKDKMYLWPKAKVYYNFDKGVGRCTYMLFAGLGRSVLGKTVPEVLRTARGRRQCNKSC